MRVVTPKITYFVDLAGIQMPATGNPPNWIRRFFLWFLLGIRIRKVNGEIK